jgi:hypothetical protein
LLTKPDQITPVLTHLQGREDKKFPLTFLTEGQTKGVRQIEINDVQYEWNTFRKLRKSDAIAVTPSVVTGVGLNNTPFTLDMKTNWLKVQHNVGSPSGILCRVMSRPTRVGQFYRYTLQKVLNDNFAIPVADLQVGQLWSMYMGANVSESGSMGNESNVVVPGKMTNQISFHRKSYALRGNIARKTVEVQFNLPDGPTRLWIDFEKWQHTLNFKQDCEEIAWYSPYNRNPDGTIDLVDQDTGLPIPYGGGVFDQIPNRDTYGQLTADKIKRTVSDVLYGSTDTGIMNIVLFTGEGGAEEFDRAMKDEASGFSLVNGGNVADKFVGGATNSHNLIFGGYFTQYKHVDGHTITLRRLPLLDFGGRAENSPKHPISGKPLESYRMTFLDMSYYDGEPNIKMVTQKGRSMVTGVLQGMASTPYHFTGNNFENIATEKDESKIHFLAAKGVCIRRATHCFDLTCDLS